MEMSEFLNRAPAEEAPVAEELDVQKAVVESLAADKAEQDERIVTLQKENNLLKSEVSSLKSSLDEVKAALAKVGDVLAQNAETEVSSKIALLDRDPELNDRFPGETRDHVLEVIREARDAAERDGRLRRAQVLESVLVANEPVGNLKKSAAPAADEGWTSTDDLHWMPRSAKLYFTRSTVEGRQLLAADPATGRETLLAASLPAGDFRIAPTEDALYYTVTKEGPREGDVHRVRIHRGEVRDRCGVVPIELDRHAAA